MGSEKNDFNELGQRLHLDLGTFTPVVNTLVFMGLVIKYRNEKDDRLGTIELMEKGKLPKEDILEVSEQIFCNFNGNIEDVIILLQVNDN